MHKIKKGYAGFSFLYDFNGRPATSYGFQSSIISPDYTLTLESPLGFQSALNSSIWLNIPLNYSDDSKLVILDDWESQRLDLLNTSLNLLNQFTLHLQPKSINDSWGLSNKNRRRLIKDITLNTPLSSTGFSLDIPTIGLPISYSEQSKLRFLDRTNLQVLLFQQQSLDLINNFIPKPEEKDFSKGIVRNASLEFLNKINTSDSTILASSAAMQSNNSNTKLEGVTKIAGEAAKIGADLLKPSVSTVSEKGFGKAFGDSTFGKNFGAWNAGLNIANLVGDTLVGNKMYGGPKGNLVQAIDTGWNTVADGVSMFGPVGLAVGLVMKGASVLNKGVNFALGSKALDNMTTTDAILNNPLTGWNIGMVNALLGRNALTITKDKLAQEATGTAYSGTFNKVDDALTKSGKRFGIASIGELRDTNNLIAEANRLQRMAGEIGETSQDRFAIRDAMSNILANNRSYKLLRGYQQGNVHSAKNGISIKTILKAKKIVSSLKYKQGGKVESYIIKEIPLETITPEFKQGGIIEVDNTSEEYLEPYILKEVSLEEYIPEFKEGGTVNVIPEGALHARLHHMEDADNLTKKGIPVVSEKENGELEQQAEIEKDEIILRLEVTKLLEELLKKYYSDDCSQKEKDLLAIEAGKLLVEEILNNTIDNTGLLNNIQ